MRWERDRPFAGKIPMIVHDVFCDTDPAHPSSPAIFSLFLLISLSPLHSLTLKLLIPTFPSSPHLLPSEDLSV